MHNILASLLWIWSFFLWSDKFWPPFWPKLLKNFTQILLKFWVIFICDFKIKNKIFIGSESSHTFRTALHPSCNFFAEPDFLKVLFSRNPMFTQIYSNLLKIWVNLSKLRVGCAMNTGIVFVTSPAVPRSVLTTFLPVVARFDLSKSGNLKITQKISRNLNFTGSQGMVRGRKKSSWHKRCHFWRELD